MRVLDMGVYYDMMMQDLLELHGSFLTQASVVSREHAVDEVVACVSGATGRPCDQVRRAIDHGLDAGLLRYTSRDGVCTWQFADCEESLRVTEVVRRPAVASERAVAASA